MNGYANLFVYGAVKVNADGKRYVNEGMFIGNAMTRALLDQPMKDEEYFDYPVSSIRRRTIWLPRRESRWACSRRTKACSCKRIPMKSLPRKAGRARFAGCHGALQRGHERDGRRFRLRPRRAVRSKGPGPRFALDTPPVDAFANVPWLAYDPVTTFIVNADSQLLDQYGTPIEGVYAVGEIALRPTLGNVYCQGAATGAGACFGMQAGRAAAHRGE